MAVLTSQKEHEKHRHKHQQPQPQPPPKKKRIKQVPAADPPPPQKQKPPSSWDQIKNLLTCKQVDLVHDPSNSNYKGLTTTSTTTNKLGSSCSSICSFKDVVHGNTRVVHRADNSPESSSVGQETGSLLNRKGGHGSSSGRTSSLGGRSLGGGGSTCNSYSSRGMQFSKLSGCYECRSVVDPGRYPLPRTTICSCSQCGEVFPKIESLELHQKVRHAVSELGPEDSSRNIVEIIFKSSWLKKDSPLFVIERILKVHNTQRTIQRFEDCRDAVKARAMHSTKKNPRCAADGNELLRFHCTSLTCSLGSRGSSSLCGSVPGCGVCTVIRHGFQKNMKDSTSGVRTTASSGRAHDSLTPSEATEGRTRAMLVCRVIAGRVKRVDESQLEEDGANPAGASGSYDSLAGQAGIYANLEELFVFNPKAILPCFVVIYRALES